MTRWSRLVLLLTLVLGACTAPAQPQPGEPNQAAPGDPINLDNDDIVLASSLEPFTACDDLLDYFKTEALKIVGPYGLPGQGGETFATRLDVDAFSRGVPGRAVSGSAASGGATAGNDAAAPVPAPMEAPAADAPAPVQGEDYSGTNVQEAGVDEPDIVKTDGRLVISAMDRRLRIVDLDNPDEIAGSLRLEGWEHELLLEGDRLLVMTRAPAPRVVPDAIRRPDTPNMWHHAVTMLTLVDISDPTDPKVETQLTLDGSYRSARMTGGVARVVLSSQPVGLPFTFPEAGGLRAERAATRENRAVINDSTVEDWLPYFVREDESTGATSEGAAVDCDAVSRPQEFSGLGLVSVLSVDLAGDLAPQGATGVVASGETVYASASTMYVTTNQWIDPEDLDDRRPRDVEDYTTEIHAFDISDPGAAEYVASGSVRGHLLNQFSMSEHAGDLRVATTDGSPWAGEDSRNQSQSFVTILRHRDGALRQIGQVGGLGRGERIYSVRFLGDMGYVVTFRETDPLYSIDLSDPTAPRTTGELKILGYSAYLHPVGEGLLLGVGQDATKRGRTLGTQISLFDVSDPEAPERIANTTLPDSSSEAEWDHHAFLYWAPESLAVIPFQSHRFVDGRDQSEAGVRGFTVQPDGIDEAGTISHPGSGAGGWRAPIRRSIVAGDRLVTLSERGLMVSDLESFERQAFTSFGR